MLVARDLVKSFGSLAVTRGVSLDLPAGRRHAVIGPNGAGKTTLFNLLTGELAPDDGSIALDGRDLTRASPDARARAGLARSFQTNNLFPDMTVGESLATACAIADGIGHRVWRRFAACEAVQARARGLAAEIGLADSWNVTARALPCGAQRQLEVGLALASRPKVLLLDEPTAGMSPEETAIMQRLIAGLPRDLTIVIIEHDMDVVFGLAERITVLDYGSILLEGTPAEVRASELVRRRYLGGAAS
jgi:branched-chain amino acid transport system ATP-binding protein